MKAFVIKNKEGKYYDCWSLGFTETINEYAIYQDRQTAENDIKNCIKDNECLGYKDDCEVVEITIAEEDLEQQLADKEVKIEVLERDVENLHRTLEEVNEELAEKEEYKNLELDHDLLIDEFRTMQENLGKEIKRQSDARERFVKEVKQLEQQIAEKDKEIEELKKSNESLSNKFDKESDMQNKIDILKYHIENSKQLLAEKDKEIEELKFEKRNIFGLIEKVSSKGKQEIRKQLCNDIKDKLRTHCDYDEKLGWYLTENKVELLIGKIEKGE